MAVTTEQVRNTNKELESKDFISDAKIKQHIDFATKEASMYGLSGDALDLAVYHKATYDTIRDVLKVQESKSKEETTTYFKIDPDYHLKKFNEIVNNFGIRMDKNLHSGIVQAG